MQWWIDTIITSFVVITMIELWNYIRGRIFSKKEEEYSMFHISHESAKDMHNRGIIDDATFINLTSEDNEEN